MSESQAIEVVPVREVGESKTLQQQLRQFISQDLIEGTDYGMIPGTKKDTLYKAGAEKIARHFGLGSRIVDSDKIVDLDRGFAMFSYTIEVFQFSSGKVVAQCQGSCNSQEKKYQKQPMFDVMNTLQKMAQKRAFVGAVVSGCAASDLFTMDLEDMTDVDTPPAEPKTSKNSSPLNSKLGLVPAQSAPVVEINLNAYVIPSVMKAYAGKKLSDFSSDTLTKILAKVEAVAANPDLITPPEITEFINAAKHYLLSASIMEGK